MVFVWKSTLSLAKYRAVFYNNFVCWKFLLTVTWEEIKMKYTTLTKLAMKVCFEAHKEQVDKGGMPYVFHPFHLAEQMETEEEICTALLHDVVEDTEYTIEDIKAWGFPEDVTNALRLLTHDSEVPYMDYVKEIKQNPIAKKVKLADLRHNSDTNRVEIKTEAENQKAQRRVEKYRMAIEYLLNE